MGDHGRGKAHDEDLGPEALGAADVKADASTFDLLELQVARIYPFSRYLAAARGDLPFDIYRDEMRRHVDAEIEEQVWARRPEGRRNFGRRRDP